MIPLEGLIAMVALTMVFAGIALEWGIPRALLTIGLLTLLLEFGPAILARRR